MRPALALPTARVFPRCPTYQTRTNDFEAAKIVSPDADGRIADLHSLRTTLATDLARENVPPMVAQRLLRHAQITTTTKHDVRLRVDDLAGGLAALTALPDASRAAPDAQKATGTDDAAANSPSESEGNGSQQNRQQSLHETVRNDANPRDMSDLWIDESRDDGDGRNSVEPADLRAFMRVDAALDVEWTREDSNLLPADYESAALTC